MIEKGESSGAIAQRLEEGNLIRSSVAFQILVVKEGLTKKIQAGDFRLSSVMTPLAMAQKMTHGTLDRWVTLLEGWRREEMTEKLAEKLKGEDSNFSEKEFLRLTKDLEGQLFPDTYLFPKDADATRVVALLTSNFQKKTANLKPEKQTLILASLVEREANHETDRPIVAGILLKRLEKGWPLQVDATVQYLVGSRSCEVGRQSCEWWPKELTREDLAVKSPYNTYLSSGLPPSPIANPGLASIKAVISPARTDYWFYLSDKEGKMHYAKTLEDHKQNIALYLR